MPIDKLKLFKEVAKTAIGELLTDFKVTEKDLECGIEECKKHSFGIRCESCKRALCQDHFYCKVRIPGLDEITTNLGTNFKLTNLKKSAIKFMCPGCIADNHAEIFEPI